MCVRLYARHLKGSTVTDTLRNPLIAFVREHQAASSMTVRTVPAMDVLNNPSSQWGIQPDGSIARNDGKFFRIVGQIVSVGGGEREVMSWDQIAYEEIDKTNVVLLPIDKATGKVLVNAKAEPGNDAPGHLLLAPALQVSRSNLEAAHGGRRPYLAELVDDPRAAFANQTYDGGRANQKKNLIGHIVVNMAEIVLVNNSFCWADPEEIDQAMLEGLVNEHLVLALAHARAHGVWR